MCLIGPSGSGKSTFLRLINHLECLDAGRLWVDGELVGYRQHRPNLGNFEGQCPSILLGDHVPERIGAIDALRPDQQQLVEAYVAGQRGTS